MLINNFKSVSNHQRTFLSLISGAEEIKIASAFLKQTGLDLVLPALKKQIKSGSSVQIIAGQNFGLTDPGALHILYNLFKDSKTCSLHLSKTDNSYVFHPKLSIFRKGGKGYVLVGSANLTSGALNRNVEASILLELKVTDQVWLDSSSFFSTLLSGENSEPATLLALKRYESFFNSQKELNRRLRSIPNRSSAVLNFNYLLLQSLFRKYKAKRINEDIFQEKVAGYFEARKILDEIADKRSLNQSEFAALLDKLVLNSDENFRFWHSGSLHRLRRKVYPHYKKFQTLVRYIRENKNKSPAEVFDQSMAYVKDISGAGVNYITEIMMTYNSKKFANLNKNPITVLRNKGDVNLKASSVSYSGEDYQEYCDLLSEINKVLGLRSMLETDSFFNDIYWKL